VSSMLYCLRVGDYSVERDRDPRDRRRLLVRIVHDRCSHETDPWPAEINLRGGERRIAARVLRSLSALKPGEAQLGGCSDFTAIARRTAESGSVTLETFDGMGVAERVEIPESAADPVAEAIDLLIDLGGRDPGPAPALLAGGEEFRCRA